jgi:two-component system nitrate/nitrite response regulator NarL
VRVVAIAEDRADQLNAALEAGVHGYLARYISAEAFLRFLCLIVLGQRVFSTRSLDLPTYADNDAIDEQKMRGFLGRRIDSSALTEREQELLQFLMEGRSNKAIARKLGVAEATVKAHMVRLFGKIGAANRTQAAVLAWTAHQPSPLESSRAPGL